jgi:hypothetical protein
MVASKALSAGVMLALAGITAILAVPPASAGTKDTPEIVDTLSDQRIDELNQPACTGVCPLGGATLDIQAAWIEQPDDGNLHIYLQMETGAHGQNEQLLTASFTVGGTAYSATAQVAMGSPVGNGAVTAGGVATAAAFEQTTMHYTIPLANIGNPSGGLVSDFYVEMVADWMGEGELHQTDRGPDSGFGTPFVLAGAGSAVTLANVTGDVFNETVSTNASTSASYVYNWTTGPAAGVLAYVANGTGNVSLFVTDANATELVNQTVEAPSNGTVELSPASAGNWTVRYDLQDFNGTFTVTIAPPASGAEPLGTTGTNSTAPGGLESVNEAGGNNTGNQTSDGEGGKSVPAPGAILAVGVLAAVALRRRKGLQ